MRGYGNLPLANQNGSGRRIGADRIVRREVGHEVLADGEIRLNLPNGVFLTDAEARRLAWGLLADLAPDDVLATPDVVTYREAQRLAVLRAVAAGRMDAEAVARELGWKIRTAQRRCAELVGDGRLRRVFNYSMRPRVAFERVQGEGAIG